jgi:hypothetical protein
MEVHHPHHLTHKKKWSEYILEFVMLFAAVTLGFFAENVREHQIIEHKTKQNLQSVMLDLKKDSILIQARIQEYQNAAHYLNRLNDVFIEFQQNKITKNDYLDKVLLISDSLRFGTSFYINNSSYKNTIASGSFSNINSIELKRTISSYYEVFGAKLNDNNKILDDVAEYYTINTLPKPGGRMLTGYSIENRDASKVKALNNFYKSNGLFEKSILSKDFIIYNQKAIDRVIVYLYLMKLFNEKNTELTQLLNKELTQD